MKTQKLLFVLFAITISSIAFAQTKSFDEEIAPWHKKAVMTCGMLKNMDSFDQQKFLKNLDELEAELKVLSEKYLNNPPAEYAKDPQWKTYLEDLMDNTNVIRERIEKKEYRLAQKYCPFYCMTFGKMHRNNGRTDLTDIMFATRMNIMGTMEMFNAHNFVGAKANLPAVKNLMKKFTAMVKDNQNYNSLFKPVEDAVNNWIIAVEKSDKQNVKASIGKYMNAFTKAYMSTL